MSVLQLEPTERYTNNTVNIIQIISPSTNLHTGAFACNNSRTAAQIFNKFHTDNLNRTLSTDLNSFLQRT